MPILASYESLTSASFVASVVGPMRLASEASSSKHKMQPTSPNHALQRTAPRVTARAFCERSGIYIWRVLRSCHGWARAAPRSAVAELGVVQELPQTPTPEQPAAVHSSPAVVCAPVRLPLQLFARLHVGATDTQTPRRQTSIANIDTRLSGC